MSTVSGSSGSSGPCVAGRFASVRGTRFEFERRSITPRPYLAQWRPSSASNRSPIRVGSFAAAARRSVASADSIAPPALTAATRLTRSETAIPRIFPHKTQPLNGIQSRVVRDDHNQCTLAFAPLVVQRREEVDSPDLRRHAFYVNHGDGTSLFSAGPGHPVPSPKSTRQASILSCPIGPLAQAWRCCGHVAGSLSSAVREHGPDVDRCGAPSINLGSR